MWQGLGGPHLFSAVFHQCWNSAFSPFGCSCQLCQGKFCAVLESQQRLNFFTGTSFKMQLRMWQILLKYESFLKLDGLKLSVPLAFQADVEVCFFFYLFTFICVPWVMFNSLCFWSPKLFSVCVCQQDLITIECGILKLLYALAELPLIFESFQCINHFILLCLNYKWKTEHKATKNNFSNSK